MKHVFGRPKSAATLPTSESSLPLKVAVRTRRAMSERPFTEMNLPQRPIDLDEISAHHKCDSVSFGDVTETTVSCDPSERQRMTALTHALAGKQRSISETFCKMVYKMAKLVREAEGSSNNEEVSEPIKLCKELEEQAVIMAKKQTLIAQQFEATVNRLEQEAMDREAANQRLIAQLNTARRSLKAQALKVKELEVASETRKPQEFTPTRPPRTVRPSSRDASQATDASPSVLSEIFPIQEISVVNEDYTAQEISYSNVVVDVAPGQQLDNATLLEDAREENLDESAVYFRLML
jgi:hypothetical protein